MHVVRGVFVRCVHCGGYVSLCSVCLCGVCLCDVWALWSVWVFRGVYLCEVCAMFSMCVLSGVTCVMCLHCGKCVWLVLGVC